MRLCVRNRTAMDTIRLPAPAVDPCSVRYDHMD
nr:MAG TPA: hypothetical protein [Caudoviricetes sp.]